MSDFTHYRVLPDHQIPERAGVTQSNDSYLEKLRKNLMIDITKLTDSEIEFDLVGVDVSIANALRRILMAEVPTIAIENVYIAVNSSIIQDEVLAHRMGMIPIRADPNKLDWVENNDETASDTIVFSFDVDCRNEKTGKLKLNGEEEYTNEKALSGALKWEPAGNQEEIFPEGVRPVHDDIVVAQLKPGQRIELEAHCRKGIGKDHAKFQPVATAAYRLLPDITFSEPVVHERAKELIDMCPMGVFDIEDMGGRGAPTPTAVVARPRDCTMCRECIRLEGWENTVQLKRVKNHFLFSIESSGCMAPETIVREAVTVLKNKAVNFLGLVDEYESNI